MEKLAQKLSADSSDPLRARTITLLSRHNGPLDDLDKNTAASLALALAGAPDSEGPVRSLLRLLDYETLTAKLRTAKPTIARAISAIVQKEKAQTPVERLERPQPQTRRPRPALALPCAAGWVEPSDAEFSEARQALRAALEGPGEGLLAFEAAQVQKSVTWLLGQNVFGAGNCLLMLQGLFLRVWDARSLAVRAAASELAAHIVEQARLRRFEWADSEATTAFHCALRVWLASPDRGGWVASVFFMVSTPTVFAALQALSENPHAREFLKDIFSAFAFYLRDHPIAETLPTTLANRMQSALSPLEPHDKNESAISGSHLISQPHIASDINLPRKLERGKETLEQELLAIESMGRSIIFGDRSPSRLRMIDAWLETLDAFASNKTAVAKLVSENLAFILEFLVLALIKADELKSTVVRFEDVGRGINSAVLKLIENSPPNRAYEALFQLIERWQTKSLQAPEDSTLTKFVEISVKCIIKLTRALRSIIERIDLTELLRTLHTYYLKHKEEREDKGIKSVKTILNELSKLKREELSSLTEILGQDIEPTFFGLVKKYVATNAAEEQLNFSSSKQTLDSKFKTDH